MIGGVPLSGERRKHMKKKLFVLLAIFAMLFAFVSCDNSTTAPSDQIDDEINAPVPEDKTVPLDEEGNAVAKMLATKGFDFFQSAWYEGENDKEAPALNTDFPASLENGREVGTIRFTSFDEATGNCSYVVTLDKTKAQEGYPSSGSYNVEITMGEKQKIVIKTSNLGYDKYTLIFKSVIEADNNGNVKKAVDPLKIQRADGMYYNVAEATKYINDLLAK